MFSVALFATQPRSDQQISLAKLCGPSALAGDFWNTLVTSSNIQSGQAAYLHAISAYAEAKHTPCEPSCVSPQLRASQSAVQMP